MYDKNHYNVVISLQLIKINERKNKSRHYFANNNNNNKKRMRVKELICSSLNGMRIKQSLPQPFTPQTGTWVLWKAQRLGGGVWGLRSNSRGKAAVDCRGTDGGKAEEETLVGNAWGGKPGSHESKGTLLSHAEGVEPSPQPLSPHASIGT